MSDPADHAETLTGPDLSGRRADAATPQPAGGDGGGEDATDEDATETGQDQRPARPGNGPPAGTASAYAEGTGGGDSPPVLGGRYLLEELIASGGMASVWRAHDELLARTVAVKVLHAHLAADDAFRERFRREAVAAAKLSHPHVVSLYDTGTDDDRVYLVMEFVDGTTLRDVIADLGTLEADQVAAIGMKVASALAYAHQRGLVHRDVKPANILIGTDGSVKVADFGIAKVEEGDDGLTKTGMVLGTAAYVAPEQILSQPVDGRADQYALGIVLYEALTGQQPFKGDSPVATAALRLERQPLPVRSLRADVPRGLDAVIMRALARDPADRFASAEIMAETLAVWTSSDDTSRTAALALPSHGSPTADLGTAGLGPAVGTAARSGMRAGTPPTASRTRAVQPAGHPGTRSESFLRTEGRWLAPVLGLLLLAGLLVSVGLATGVIEPTTGGFPIRIATDRDGGEPAGEQPDPGAVQLTPATIAVFDPQGTGDERDQDLPNLLDGDPATTWRTQRYNSAPFGGLKDGVGFVLDLGAPAAVDEVRLHTTTPGVGVELRVAETPAPDVDGWTVIATGAESGEVVVLRPAEPVTTQHLLVWLTGPLAPSDGRFIAQYHAVEVVGRS
jgi:eukaryotic-like serine/threonine-protein kinase